MHACHWTDCQKMCGAPFSAIATAYFSNIKIEDNPNESIKLIDSSNRRVQAFCGDYGTHFYATDMERTAFNLRTGFLEEEINLNRQNIYSQNQPSLG